MAQPLRPGFRQAWRKASRIHGWLTEPEARLLHRYARSHWCEIGCFLGRATTILATSGPGTSIDSFTGTPAHDAEVGYYHDHDVYAEFQENTAGLPVNVLVGDFHSHTDNVPELRFLYLDADHSLDGTRDAFELYSPRLRRGGIVAFHDVGDRGWPDVATFTATLTWPVAAWAGRIVAYRKP